MTQPKFTKADIALFQHEASLKTELAELKEIADAKLKAPVAINALGPNQPPPGTLKRSLIMKQIPELSDQQKQTFFVTVRHGKQYRNQGKKGNLSQDAWYWRFVEFGTTLMAAQPFLRPAFDVKKNDAVTAITTRLAERIEQAAQELKK